MGQSMNCKDASRQSYFGQPNSSRTPHNIAVIRDSVVRIPNNTPCGSVKSAAWNQPRVCAENFDCRSQSLQDTNQTQAWWHEKACMTWVDTIFTGLESPRFYLSGSGLPLSEAKNPAWVTKNLPEPSLWGKSSMRQILKKILLIKVEHLKV